MLRLIRGDRVIENMKTQYMLVFQMMETIVNDISEETYYKKIGGHFFWQQLLHALMGSHFWFRLNNEPFVEPFLDREYFPEFQQEPDNVMPREELLGFILLIRAQVDEFFDNKTDEWLSQNSALYPKLSNIEIITMQIRHLMYHTGYCSALMNNEDNYKMNWIDYYGN